MLDWSRPVALQFGKGQIHGLAFPQNAEKDENRMR
jgi:hypothetical protein